MPLRLVTSQVTCICNWLATKNRLGLSGNDSVHYLNSNLRSSRRKQLVLNTSSLGRELIVLAEHIQIFKQFSIQVLGFL